MLMIRLHNGRSNAIGLDWDFGYLEVVKVESKEGNGRNDKGKLKNQMLQIRMIMWKFRITVQIRPDEKNWLHSKVDVWINFAWTYEFLHSHATPLISHDHAKMIVFMRKGQSSCKIMILMLNSIFVNLDWKVLKDQWEVTKCPLDLGI